MSKFRLIMTLLFMASLAGSVVASDCNHRRGVVVQQQYVQPYVQPYVAPVQQVNYGNYYDRVLLVPKVQRLQDKPDHYYDLSAGYRDALLADAIAFRILLAQQMGQTGKVPPPVVPRYPGGPNDVPVAPGVPVNPMQPALPDIPPGNGSVGIRTAVPEKLAVIVKNQCIKCHNGPGQNGLDLADLSTVSADQRWKSYSFVNVGKMPKGGQVANEDVEPFYQWAELGEAAVIAARKSGQR